MFPVTINLIELDFPSRSLPTEAERKSYSMFRLIRGADVAMANRALSAPAAGPAEWLVPQTLPQSEPNRSADA
jgi:hypothetical protein